MMKFYSLAIVLAVLGGSCVDAAPMHNGSPYDVNQVWVPPYAQQQQAPQHQHQQPHPHPHHHPQQPQRVSSYPQESVVRQRSAGDDDDEPVLPNPLASDFAGWEFSYSSEQQTQHGYVEPVSRQGSVSQAAVDDEPELPNPLASAFAGGFPAQQSQNVFDKPVSAAQNSVVPQFPPEVYAGFQRPPQYPSVPEPLKQAFGAAKQDSATSSSGSKFFTDMLRMNRRSSESSRSSSGSLPLANPVVVESKESDQQSSYMQNIQEVLPSAETLKKQWKNAKSEMADVLSRISGGSRRVSLSQDSDTFQDVENQMHELSISQPSERPYQRPIRVEQTQASNPYAEMRNNYWL